MNDNLILISGKTGTGKSMSLANLKDQPGVMYLNTETGKKLPFKNDFDTYTITDPLQVKEAFEVAETMPHIHTIVVDSLTYLMDMYNSVYVRNSDDGRSAWGDYAEYFRDLMQQYVAKSTKNVVFTAHTADVQVDELNVDTMVKIQGSLMNTGVESWFSCVVSTKIMNPRDLAPYSSDLLNIDEEEEAIGVKHTFQTRKTRETSRERIRGPLKMWTVKETYIDNDIQAVIDRLHEYYK